MQKASHMNEIEITFHVFQRAILFHHVGGKEVSFKAITVREELVSEVYETLFEIACE